jgi:YD repeat-containing protein
MRGSAYLHPFRGAGHGRRLTRRSGTVTQRVGWLLGATVMLAAMPRCADAQCANPPCSDQYFYDPAGRLTGMLDPVNGSAQYVYDAAGNIKQIINNSLSTLVVLGVSPSGGPPGTQVTISGTGFTSGATVSFNGAAASGATVTPTAITVSVPANATTGPVTVTTSSGTSSSASPFTVQAKAAPTVTSISPKIVEAATYSYTGNPVGFKPPKKPITISGQNFDPALTKVFINGRFTSQPNVSCSASGSCSSLTVIPPVVGSGKLVVETPSGTTGGNQDIIVLPSCCVQSGTFDNSQRVVLQQTVTLNYSGPANGHFVAALIDGTVGERLSAAVTFDVSPAAPGEIFLIGPDGEHVETERQTTGSQTSPVWNLTWSLRQNGTYSLFIQNPNQKTDSAKSATVTFSTAPAPASGSVAAAGSPVTVTIGSPYQGAVFSIPQNIATGRISILSQADASLGQSPFLVSLFAPDGFTELYDNNRLVPPGTNFVSGATDFSGAVPIPALSPTTSTTSNYTLNFQPQGPATGNATITVSSVPPDASGSLTVNGSALPVTTTAAGQKFVPSFSISSPAIVSLLTQPDSNLSTNCLKITLTGPNNATPYSSYQCGPADFSGQLSLAAAGTYTLSVDPSWTAFGTANFTLNGLNAPSAVPIAVGGSAVATQISAPGQVAQLSFAGSASETVKLTTSTGSGSFAQQCLLASIANSSGTVLGGHYQCAASQSLDSIVLPAADTYTISLTPIGPLTGTVTTTLSTGTPILAGTIPTTGAPVTASALTAGQAVTWTFQAPATTSVALATSPAQSKETASGNCYEVTVTDSSTPNKITLYDTNTQTIPSCNTGNFSGPLSLAGTTPPYTVAFTPAKPATGKIMPSVTETLFAVPTSATGNLTVDGTGLPLVISVPGQSVVGSFTVPAAQYVNVSVGADTTLAGDCFRVQTQLQGSSTGPIADDVACNGQYSSVLALPSAGSYTVTVFSKGRSVGTASINVSGR